MESLFSRILGLVPFVAGLVFIWVFGWLLVCRVGVFSWFRVWVCFCLSLKRGCVKRVCSGRGWGVGKGGFVIFLLHGVLGLLVWSGLGLGLGRGVGADRLVGLSVVVGIPLVWFCLSFMVCTAGFIFSSTIITPSNICIELGLKCWLIPTPNVVLILLLGL